MKNTYILIAVAVAVVGFLIAWYVRKRFLRRETVLVLYHKPTGLVIEIPARYEAEAIEQMLTDLKKVPGVPLDSPEFQIIRTPAR